MMLGHLDEASALSQRDTTAADKRTVTDRTGAIGLEPRHPSDRQRALTDNTMVRGMSAETVSTANSRPKPGTDLFYNTAILKRILRALARERRTSDILAILYANRQGADVAGRALYTHLFTDFPDGCVPERVSRSLPDFSFL